MKTTLCLYLLTCLAVAFPEYAFCRASAEEGPVKYIFELSDEPVKVQPGKIDTKSVFFPKYARGTSPEALKRQAAGFQTQTEQAAPEHKVSIDIHMNSDRDDAEENTLTGYDFHYPNPQDGLAVTTESPDEEVWLNDGDPDSPFFHTPRSATNTEVREISHPSDVWPGWHGETVDLSMSLPESPPRPFVISPTPSGPIRTIIKSFNGKIFETEHRPLHPVWDELPPGYVPIPALPAYQPTVLKKLKNRPSRSQNLKRTAP